MKLLFITNSYPKPGNPNAGIFVYKLVQKFIELGNEVTVISPRKISFSNLFKRLDTKEKAIIYRPYFMSWSSKQIGNYHTYPLTKYFATKAVKKVLKSKSIEYDAIYCHFFNSALMTSEIFPDLNKQLFVAFGESIAFDHYYKFSTPEKFKNLVSKITGLIAVSKENRERAINMGIDKDKILLAPNATNQEIFYPRNKTDLRQEFKFQLNIKIIIFIGSFTHNKGADRVLEAIEGLSNVYGIFLGKGREIYSSERILFQGTVSNNMVAEFMGCADAFVLPTLYEGSNNSIVEAMSCGLPIVSSDIKSVREQCDPSFSILIDPINIEQIRDAISHIVFDEKNLKKMAQNALHFAKRYSINDRAKSIELFLKEKIK